MVTGDPSLLYPSCWSPSFTVRLCFYAVCIIVGLGSLFIPWTKKWKALHISIFVCLLLSLLAIGLDKLGYPAENLFGFRSIENACYYACKGTVVDTVEGTDSTLVIAEKKAHYYDGVSVVGDIAVYQNDGRSWKMVNSKMKKKQIVLDTKAGKYLVYIMQAKDSADRYLILYDFYCHSEAVSCSEASDFKRYTEEYGTSYWYAQCSDLSAGQELHIEIQEENETSRYVIPLNTDDR